MIVRRLSLHALAIPAAASLVLVLPAAAEETPSGGCEYRLAPIYLWAPINTTTASESETSPPIDVTRGETGLNTALGARFELATGPTRVSLEELYASISYKAAEAGGGERELNFRLSLFELYAGRAVGHDVSVVGGLRFYRGKLTYTSTNVASIDQEQTLRDPVVGIWYRPRLSKTWTGEFAADVGGFNFGFDWSSFVSAIFTWKPSKHVGGSLGYRALYMKKTGAEGLLKTTFYGPVFGLEVFW
jgi:hypothetical protein